MSTETTPARRILSERPTHQPRCEAVARNNHVIVVVQRARRCSGYFAAGAACARVADVGTTGATRREVLYGRRGVHHRRCGCRRRCCRQQFLCARAGGTGGAQRRSRILLTGRRRCSRIVQGRSRGRFGVPSFNLFTKPCDPSTQRNALQTSYHVCLNQSLAVARRSR